MKRPFLRSFQLLIPLCLGCTDSGSAFDSGPPETETDVVEDSPPDTISAGAFEIPASTGSYDVTFGIGLDGEGADRIGAIDVTAGAGTVEIDGQPLPVAIYERQAWEAFGYTLYQGLAVASDRWYLLWFYCRDGSLTDIYYEGTAGGSMALASASGDCHEASGPSTVDISYPASSLSPAHRMDGFEVTGDNISLDGDGPGAVTLDGTTYEVTVFNRVDCSTECGAPGWHELHALLWDAQRQWLCFGIFYLFGDQRPVQLTYAFSLPALQAPFGVVSLSATWTGP